MMPLFPEIEPYQHFYLKVDDIHDIYVEACGNPRGIPVIYLHGGPGAGCQPKHRQYFDPKQYHIILFDQRGAGRSKPFADIRNNTLAHLLSDMEKIRHHFKVKRWLVYGGSWGSTLALAYGEAFSEACLGFILRGVFLMRESEIAWFLDGVQHFYPEYWDVFSNFCNHARSHKDILHFMENIYRSGTEAQQIALASAYAKFEAQLLRLIPTLEEDFDAHQALALSKIAFHYFYTYQKDFKHLLKNIKKINHLPCSIVQGRYDMVCPPISAYEVHKAWPGSQLVMVPDAGHSASEPGISAALLEATEAFKRNLI